MGWATVIKPDVVITAVETGSGMNTGVGAFTLSGNISGDITALGSGSWNGLVYTFIPGPDLNEGETYTATMANAADVAGNVADTLTFTFQVDVQPPTISGLQPTHDTWVAAGTPMIQATVQDIGSGIDESTIVMMVDGSAIVHSYASGTGVVSYIPSSALSEGAHTVTVDVSDNAGNAATQASWTFNVDTVHPVIDEATWAGPWTHEPGHWTNNASPTITVGAYDPGFGVLPPTGSGINASSVKCYLNGTLEASSYNTSTGRIEFGVSSLADGEYTLEAHIDDNAGNPATPKSITFHVDATGPAFANPYPLNEYETNNRGLAPHIDITDVGGAGVDPDSIAWTMAKLGGLVDGTLTPPWDGLTSTFTADADLTPDGYYYLTVSAADLVGNNSTYPLATWSFLLDTTKPELDSVVLDVYRRIPDVAGGVIYTPLKQPEIRVDFHDPAPGSGFNGVVCDVPGTFDVYVYADADMTVPVVGTLNRDATPLNNSAPWGGEWVPTPNLPDGDYFVKVVITDDAGNTRDPETYDFRFIVDTTPPDIEGSESEIGFLNNNNNRRFANSRMLEVKWDRTPDPEAEVGVPGSGLLGYEFEIWTKAEGDADPTGEYLQYGYTDEDSFNSSWLWIVEPTGTGTEVYTMRRPAGFESGKSYGAWLRAYDMMHNGSDWFDPPFIFDPDAPTDPGAPEVQGLKDPATDRRTNDSTPELKWAHSTDEKAVAQSGVDLYEVQITAAGTTTWDIHYEVDIFPDEDVDKVLPDSPLTGDFSWTVPAPLADGAYEVRVRAKDVAGNYSAWVKIAAAFTVDTQAPPVPGIPSTTSPTKSVRPSWTWTLSPGAVRYNVYLDGAATPGVTVLDPSPDPMSFVYPADLAEGIHHLQVTAIDNLGNESVKSGTGHVVIDLTAPVVPEMAGLPAYTNADGLMLVWTAVDSAVKYDVEYTIAGAATTVADIDVQTLTINIAAPTAVDGNEITAKVRAYDAVGNVSGWSDVVSTTVDRTGPVVSVVTTPTSPTNNPRPTWAWSGIDALSGVDYYTVTLDGELPFATTGTSFTPASSLADGTHVLKVKAVDKAGNVGAEVAFMAVVIDTTPPAVPGMPQTTSPTKNPSPVWTWGAVADAVKYRVFEDEVDKGFVTEPTYPSDSLGEGTHYLQVTALDALGNESAKSEAGYVVIDLTPPGAPVMKTLPRFTNAATVRFEWTKSSADTDHYEISYSVDGGEEWSAPLELAGEFFVVGIEDVADGVAVSGRVRAYDEVGNVSAWSDGLLGAPIASTIVDRTGPVVAITNPTEPVFTNAATFTYEWSAIDAGCGVRGYTVVFNGGKHEVTETSDDDKYAYEGTLNEGDNTFEVVAVDNLGNKSAVVAKASVVKQVKPQIGLVQPMPGGRYKINEISTIAFMVTGLYEAPIQVSVNNEVLDPWRIVTVVNEPTLAKFYVLLDGEVLLPGPMAVTITVGSATVTHNYTVDSERSGFGFGRLRLW